MNIQNLATAHGVRTIRNFSLVVALLDLWFDISVTKDLETTDERRISPRVDAKIEVQFNSGDEFVRCYSSNISKGGILLETETMPDPNALIDVVLFLPKNPKASGLDKISLRGRIVRRISFSEPGKQVHKVAIQFVDVSPDSQNELDRLYENLMDVTES